MAKIEVGSKLFVFRLGFDIAQTSCTMTNSCTSEPHDYRRHKYTTVCPIHNRPQEVRENVPKHHSVLKKYVLDGPQL